LVTNRPGLNAIAYRVGTQPQFKESLLAKLSTLGPNGRTLTTRHTDDFTIGLLDAWSTMADVLTFYQERIANESYLRTATERLSVQEMARLIGYELQPGVAASTYLAFTLDSAPGAFAPQLVPVTAQTSQTALPPVTITPQTKVQSIPGPGEDAQSFETVETIEARADWNAMKPRLTQPQVLSPTMSRLLLFGTSYALKVGDVILINKTKLRKILAVSVDETAKTTRVDFVAEASFAPYVVPVSPVGQVSTFLNQGNLVGSSVLALQQKSWSGANLAAIVAVNNWSSTIISFTLGLPPAPPRPTPENGAYVFRKRAFFFGYNAPPKTTYPAGIPTFGEWDASENATKIFLDTAYEELLAGGVIAIQGADTKLEDVTKIVDVQQVDVRSRTAYGLSAKTTALTVPGDWRQLISSNLTSLASLRDQTIYAQNEPLITAEIPIDEVIQGNNITLDRYYPGLRTGQKLMLIGSRTDLPGVVLSEVMTIKEITIVQGLTVLDLEQSLTYAYVRNSVTINGNVALATHGETVLENLGSGDARRAFQRFVLRQPPLTYVSGATATGAKTTLEIRVNDLLWHEVPSLIDSGPQDRVYITRLDDAGKTTVMFGDGITGARLPTGPENVKATYRKGMGLAGLVKANQLSQLISRPMGVKGVNNPMDATGAASRETLTDARRNAPLPILTLGRIVSLSDYADFARSFAGVEKALATWTWFGQRRGLFLTVAGANGAVIDRTSSLYANLVKAVRQAGAPNVSFRIETYTPAFFQVAANVQIHPDYLPKAIFENIEITLRQRFAFAARDFGQAVAYSDVIATMQGVKGVVAVELDAFFRTDETVATALAETPRLLEANVPRPGADTVFPAELLTLDPRPVILRQML